MNSISITRAAELKPKPQDESNLGNGMYFTDHMFSMNYHSDKGWYDARIVPYGPISLDPASTCLHYGQLIFEGMKGYRANDGRTLLFRPHNNMQRLNASAARMCIPPVDVDFMVNAIAKLVDIEKEWIPRSEGTSLYIRPFIISTDCYIGVQPSESYLLNVILCPLGHYLAGGLKPVRIFVEDEYVRAVKGGVGYAKCAGNYAASLIAQVKAHKLGCAQVLWLDGVNHKYVDEVGHMNVFFVMDGKVVTPELTGAILPGITRDSVITMLKSWDIPVEERLIDIQEIADAAKSGKLEEIFGCGTAAVISPVGELIWGDVEIKAGDGKTGPISRRIYENLTGIQRGVLPDPFGWSFEVK
ncbi:MAG: branched-chain amino acid aminotransferase [Synergistaceae bacterium]|nr:branched-chain amino acid aminotransferase [Synergistaceae bacterium]